MHVAEAQRMTRSKITWLCDSMDDATTVAFGKPYNGEFVIDPEGKIVRQRFWSNPITLRKDLETLVRKVDKPTRPEDVESRFRPEPREIASGVVPRIKLPQGLTPILVKHIEHEDQPAYFKLRAELTPRKNRGGKYQLYLGFYPDPIYRVHWNNAAGPVKVEMESAKSLGISTESLTGPEVEEAADVDARMFLIDLESKDASQPIKIKLHAVVCDDAETFCVPLTQEYQVTLKPANNGSTRPGIFLDRMFADVRGFDANKDDKITADELPAGRVTMYMNHIDTNLDNVIDLDEIQVFESMFNNGRGMK